MSTQLIIDPRLTASSWRSQSRQQLLRGLMSQPASVPPSYLYDALGSRLFAAITELPEYYLTRTEASLLSRHAAQIVTLLSPVGTLVDLGAGDCKKAAQLLPSLHPDAYVAVDVSGDCVADGAGAIAGDFPDIAVTAYVTDFSSGMHWPEGMRCEQPVFFYLGSSIGNFSPEHARHFLSSLRDAGKKATHERLLLIGVDLIKSIDILEAAYTDAIGLTACFNLNLLRHLNQIIGADFNVRHFRHHAMFDARHGRIEMSLVSQREQTVRWPGGERDFGEGERIVTEHSYKYTIPGFEKLLQASGYNMLQRWTDDHESYLLCAARPVY